MAWGTLATIAREAAAQAEADAVLEALDCPDCCNKLVERADGVRVCTFDGYRAERLRRA